MKLQNRVALRIKTIRKQKGLTQELLAERIDRTTDAVSQLERGRSLPSFETLERLSAALGVPIRDFFDLDDQSKSSPRRESLFTKLIYLARNMSDKELQTAVQLLEVISDRNSEKN